MTTRHLHAGGHTPGFDRIMHCQRAEDIPGRFLVVFYVPEDGARVRVMCVCMGGGGGGARGRGEVDVRGRGSGWGGGGLFQSCPILSVRIKILEYPVEC